MALVTIWILAVAAAVIFRHVARLTTNLKLSVWLSDGRTAIYFITYIVWGILLRRHVVVRSVKRWLSAIVFLMLFWMIVRTVKFRLPNTSVLGRQLLSDISNLSACDDFHYVLYVEWSHSSQYRL